MPLLTDNLAEARIAYSALENRAQSSEAYAQTLLSSLNDLRARLPQLDIGIERLKQRIAELEAENSALQLQIQQLTEQQIKADVSLDNFIAAMGMSAVLGESSMRDRSVGSIGASVQAYLGVSSGSIALRLHQPESTQFAGLSSTSFEIAKIPPAPGQPATRNLYVVLEDTQHVYTDPYWLQFLTATQPPQQPALQIVTEISQIFAQTGGWTFPFLSQEMAVIARFEKSLSDLLANAVPGSQATAYQAAVDSLLALTSILTTKAFPVAGDLMALTAAVDSATTSARSFLP